MLRKPAIVLLPLLLAGCSLLAPPHGARAPERREVVEATQLAAHIDALDTAMHGDAAAQATALAAARAAWEETHLGSAGLRYGLLLATLAPPARDPLAAQGVLRDLLAREQLPAAGERALAEMELARLDREFTLAAEGVRLNTELAQERERARDGTANLALTRRLQAESEENARLRKALDEARAKLDAITNIERRYTDRPPNEARQP
jgi:hypothetical protein